MRSSLVVLVSLASQAMAQLKVAKSWTGWDCCKPICATHSNRRDILDNRGVVSVCNRDNRFQLLDAGIRAPSGCVNNGANAAYMCDSYQPVPVTNDLSYGFAVLVSDTQTDTNPACCRCLQVQWLTGGARNKTMIVQVVTPGGPGGDVKKDDLIILTPGGGSGPLTAGCPNQYGKPYNWGNSRGGVTNRQACERLPSALQGGCYWRWNWAQGELNGWDIIYQPIQCPSRLIDISGCSA